LAKSLINHLPLTGEFDMTKLYGSDWTVEGGAIYGQIRSRPRASAGCAFRTDGGEYFRIRSGCVLFIDNIFRFTQAALKCRCCWAHAFAVGYQPNLASEMGEMQERITLNQNRIDHFDSGVYVPADDYTDPAPATTFAHIERDGFIATDCRVRIYPAVDPLTSSFAHLDPRIIARSITPPRRM